MSPGTPRRAPSSIKYTVGSYSPFKSTLLRGGQFAPTGRLSTHDCEYVPTKFTDEVNPQPWVSNVKAVTGRLAFPSYTYTAELAEPLTIVTRATYAKLAALAAAKAI